MKSVTPIVYEIMHGDRKVAQIDQYGHTKIYFPSFMPYSLYLEKDEGDIDTLVNNITNFYYWCSTRVLTLDRHNYYMMNIIDYLIGNTDRHWGNWGVLVENASNKPVSLHKLMDFNRSFQAYDTLDGANCQTLFGVHKNQREAAEEAVREIGLNQLRPVKKEVFHALPHYYERFLSRLEHLKNTENNL